MFSRRNMLKSMSAGFGSIALTGLLAGALGVALPGSVVLPGLLGAGAAALLPPAAGSGALTAARLVAAVVGRSRTRRPGALSA